MGQCIQKNFWLPDIKEEKLLHLKTLFDRKQASNNDCIKWYEKLTPISELFFVCFGKVILWEEGRKNVFDLQKVISRNQLNLIIRFVIFHLTDQKQKSFRNPCSKDNLNFSQESYVGQFLKILNVWFLIFYTLN